MAEYSKVDTSTEAVEALLEGVTPGPWAVDEDETYCDVTTDHGITAENFIICEHAYKDARFIAAARDLVPALLAERDRLMKERDEARAELAEAWTRLDYWCERSYEWDAEMLQKDREVLEAIARAALTTEKPHDRA